MEIPVELQGLVIGLHHVAIAVPSIAAARKTWEAGLGLQGGEPEHVPGQRVNVLVLRAGEQRIELVEPAADDSPISAFLARRGAGLHHIALLVDDIDAALERLEGSGLRMIDREARAGADGTRIAFLHPRSTNGVLVELVEEPRH